MENKEETDFPSEKPLSPVLSNNKMTRKFLQCRRMQKKSRVKLTDRFTENTLSNSSAEDSITFPQSQDIEGTTLDKSDLQVENKSIPDFAFKKPLSPVITPDKLNEIQPGKVTECSGFKTAGGKSINCTDDMINRSKKLFDDILSPKQNVGSTGRSNKYSFLSKRKSDCKSPHEKLLIKDMIQFENKSKKSTVDSCIGFTTASGKNVLVTEASYNTAYKKFEELPGFKPTSDPNETTDDAKDIMILSTQETDQLFSDFTMLENKQEISDIDTEKFKGFCTNIIEDSSKYDEDFKMVILKLKTMTPKSYKITASDDQKTVIGFATALGNKIDISSSALRTARNKFEKDFDFNSTSLKFSGSHLNKTQTADLDSQVCDDDKTLVPISTNISLDEVHNQTLRSNGFTTASGYRISVSKSALGRAHEIFQNTDDTETATSYKLDGKLSTAGFKTAGGNSVDVSDDAIKRAQQFFQNIENEGENNYKSETLLSTSDRSLQKSYNLKPLVKSDGFSTASGSRLSASKSALAKAQELFTKTDIESMPLIPKISDENVKPSAVNLSEDGLSKTKYLFQGDLSLNQSSNSSTSTNQENCSFGEANSSLLTKNNSNSARKKKRLGLSSCKPIKIPKHKIEQALKLFEDGKSAAIMSPIRISAPSVYNSTPLKGAQIIDIDTDITPIKNINSTLIGNREFEQPIVNDRFTIQECTKGTIDTWTNMMENEKKELERKIQILTERQECLRVQKHLMQFNIRRQRSGVLFNKKQSKERIPLQKFIEIDSSFRRRFDITPKKAELLHFNYTNHSKIQTLDGACVVPNINELVGLSEIETAFKVMDGVDPKLIPNGWIRNHFKWIVWKLASYENFAVNMKESLTLENVIQQLKYRYDREIDRAERSTLRKIFEMDDAPQKRMVLCVSDILRLGNQFELELTDGWYSIRTVIDEPLCKQISRKKIQIGTKLIMNGAELLNCEGCHPLEATDLVRLKINSNSTRRARWFIKLGYQRCPEPFPLKLNSVFSNGGLIGCVKIFVARVYPIKFMERQNKLTVWRNRKAEELRAQEWENKGRQDMEKLRETITKDYEQSKRIKRNLSLNLSNDEIKNVNCPEILFNLCQNSKDPEGLQELLSDSQKRSIVEYQQRLSFIEQQEMSRAIQDRVGKLQPPKRDVSSVLQLLVLDVCHPSDKTYIFQIWRPLDIHVETIKESSFFNVYNVLPSKNGGFSTINRTTFKLASESFDFVKYKRSLLRISDFVGLKDRPLFNEFDTVGLVVTMDSSNGTQSIWLADSSKQLLFIKIFESLKTCLLLDKLKVGQIVSASNLIYCKSKFEFGEATANHQSVISCYPQLKHLQDGIASLSQHLPKDLEIFLEECRQKITKYVDIVEISKTHMSVSVRSLVQSNSVLSTDVFDDSSDILFSTIDVDKFS